MHEAVISFARSVQIKTCRVINTPNLVFLCGGLISHEGPPRSARDVFHRHLKDNHPEIFRRVKLAETVSAWFIHDTFTDLLEMEEYLADVADIILLFVESPGSIAELGAFAASNALQPKTLAILNGLHPTERTFIADGPVRRIQLRNSEFVHYYDWDFEKPDDSAAREELNDLCLELSQLLIDREENTPNEAMVTGSHGHLMLLIADLIDIVGIVTREDISDCLREWGYECSSFRLTKYLSLLHDLNIVRTYHYANQKYFVSIAPSPFIRYDFRPNARATDRMRIVMDARSTINSKGDKRSKALRAYLRRKPYGGRNV